HRRGHHRMESEATHRAGTAGLAAHRRPVAGPDDAGDHAHREFGGRLCRRIPLQGRHGIPRQALYRRSHVPPPRLGHRAAARLRQREGLLRPRSPAPPASLRRRRPASAEAGISGIGQAMRRTIIPNRGDLRRKAVNYKTGLDLKLDDEMLQKMEALVQNSSAQFIDQTVETLKALRETLARAAADPATRAEALEQIREEAFQIKGMGGVFGYPLLTEFAKSLHDFLKELNDLDELQQEIVSIHIDT